MKLALGMMVHNDTAWLRLHLPIVAYRFDGIVMAVETREECEMLLLELQSIIPGFKGYVTVVVREFHNDWSEMFNHILAAAELPGFDDAPFDAILRLDPDELMHPADIDAARELLETYAVLCFARYNFWADRCHYTPGIFPDWQCRAFHLNKGIRLGGKHHEGVGWTKFNLFEGDPVADTPRQVLRVPSIVLYHYGNVGRERILERDFHYFNLAREEAGHPPLAERPADRAFPTRHSIPFRGVQPLNPDEIGIYAPFSE